VLLLDAGIGRLGAFPEKGKAEPVFDIEYRGEK
jgi:hypothetical protein